MGWPRRAVVSMTCVVALAACFERLNLDLDIPTNDAGADGGPSVPGDASPPAPVTDAAVDANSDPQCNELPTETCKGKCDQVEDRCGTKVPCPACPLGKECVANTCQCKTDPQFCTNRCGDLVDNCGRAISCSAICLAPKTCQAGVCADPGGCVPRKKEEVCAAIKCGSVLNNCDQPVACDDKCVFPETCGGGGAGPNGCGCTPLTEEQACPKAQCGGAVSNGCGGSLLCTSDCRFGNGCKFCDGFCPPSGSVCKCKTALECK